MIKGLVSIIIPTYKRPNMLGRAIESGLNQCYSNVEIIVIDDNNEDDIYRTETIEFMKKYINIPNVKYIKHVQNKNGAQARNTGILASKGEFIAFLDDDDYFLPYKINEQVRILEALPEEYGGVCCNYIKTYKNLIYKVSKNNIELNSSFELLSGKIDLAAGSTLLIHRKVIDKIGLFDISFNRHQDWEFLIRFFRYYKLVIAPSIGVVICADGIRNNPNTNSLINIKQHLFSVYSVDIDLLSHTQQHLIHINQSYEILYNYIRERQYKLAKQFMVDNKLKNNNLYSLLNILISIAVGFYPKSIILLYRILNNFYKNKYNQYLIK